MVEASRWPNTNYTTWAEVVPWATGLVCTATPPATTVVYDGSCYKCKTSHTAGASFDATKWTLIAQGATAFNVPSVVYSDIAATTISLIVVHVLVSGHTAVGDGGGGYSLKRSASTTPSAWNIQSQDGAFWQIVPPDNFVNVRWFGARGDGVTRDDQAFATALAAAKALGVGFVDFGAGTYVMHARIDQSAYDGIQLRGDKLAVLDFSTASAPWENSSPNGLIYASGTKSTGYAIAAKAYKTARKLIISSITVAAGVATATCTYAHGLATGDRVHVGGQTSSTPVNEQGLFSTPWQPFGTVGDIPHNITVTGPTTFTYPTTATANLTGSVLCFTATNVIELDTGLGANFAAGDVLLVNCNVVLTGTSTTVKDGELTRVKLVSGDVLILSHSLEVDVDPANSPLAYKVTMPRVGAIGDFLILGRGYNPTGSSYGQVGVRYSYCDRSPIQVRTHRVDQTGAEFRSCLDSVMEVTATFGTDDEGGRTTGLEKIQYGVSIANACRNCTVQNSHVWGARHGMIVSHTSDEPGRSWSCHVTRCEFGGAWYSNLNTQNTNGSLTVSHCRFSGRSEAINHRAGRIVAHHNEAINCRSFMLIYRRPEAVIMTDNLIKGCVNGAVEFTTAFEAGFWPEFEFSRNHVDGGEYGIHIIDLPLLGVVDLRVSICDNRFDNIQRIPIYLRTSTTKYSGVVSGNRGKNVGLIVLSSAIRIENGDGVIANDNHFVEGTGNLDNIVYFEGASSANNYALRNSGVGHGGSSASFATGSGHRSDSCAQSVEAATNTAETLYPRVWCDGKVVTFSADVASIDMTGSRDGDMVSLMRTSGSPVLKTTGNLRLAGSADLTVSSSNTTVTFLRRGAIWYEIARAVA